MSILSFKEQVTAKAYISNENRAVSKRRAYLNRPFQASFFKKKLYDLAFRAYQSEYVWDVEDKEQQKLEELKSNILSGTYKTDKSLEVALVTLSCYQILYKSDVQSVALDLEKKLSSPQFSTLVQYSIVDFIEEDKIKSNIKSFGSISNTVSKKVREQYEENPYPRWINPERVLENDVSNQNKLNILVAGCGTGKQLYKFSKDYPNATITAIDLSLASLSYAKRKMDSYQVKNITFHHGDILDVKDLKQTYDLIISTGVLHHMENPKAGWKALTSVLNPGGQFIISLYSSHARAAVRIARATLIEPQMMSYSMQNLRKVRRHIKKLPSEHNLAPLTLMGDFYSTSECRDMLFHVQEHQFDIPQIKEHLDELGLKFISFFRKDNRLDTFFQQHSSPEDFKNLDLWDEFEKKNPLAFIGMYNFTCAKEDKT